MLGFGEILIIGLVLVLFFGTTQIPKLAKSLGEGLKEFKKALKEGEKEQSPGEGLQAQPKDPQDPPA